MSADGSLRAVLYALSANFGMTFPEPPPLPALGTQVPEPGVAMLSLVAAACLARRRR